MHTPFLVCQCTIVAADGKSDVTFVREGSLRKPLSQKHQNLIGCHTLPSVNLLGLDGSPGVFYIFSDLSVRNEGLYKLRFSLLDVAG